jgi:Ca2+-binding EF-hand superfamily protein
MKAELIEAFKIFDTENKGFISAKELKQRLEQMGE